MVGGASDAVIEREVSSGTGVKVQARAGKTGENTGAVKQVHFRFGLCVLHQLISLEKRVQRGASAVR